MQEKYFFNLDRFLSFCICLAWPNLVAMLGSIIPPPQAKGTPLQARDIQNIDPAMQNFYNLFYYISGGRSRANGEEKTHQHRYIQLNDGVQMDPWCGLLKIYRFRILTILCFLLAGPRQLYR